MDFLIDLYQQRQISDATRTAYSAKETANRSRSDIDDLKRKADALTLACQALWEIVRVQTGLSDDTILDKMQEIDLRDGSADGRISHRVLSCPSCQRTSKASRKICLYCGAAMPTENVFEKS
jgi:hypothetical protein